MSAPEEIQQKKRKKEGKKGVQGEKKGTKSLLTYVDCFDK